MKGLKRKSSEKEKNKFKVMRIRRAAEEKMK
jgi:hypothetical protein